MIGYVVESKDIFTQILKFQIFLKKFGYKLFLKSLGVKNYSMWDDSFGFIGFRMIRPNYNDGYPLSCKSMGFAKKIISCWMPLIGLDKTETLLLVKGSNNKKYDSYMPRSSKFEKSDLRLSKKYKLKTVSFDLKPGDNFLWS